MVLLNRVVRRVRGELRDLDADPGVRIPLGRIWLVVNDCLPIRPAPVHVAIIRITAFVPIRLHHVDGNFSHGHRRVKAYPRTVLIRRHVGILEHRKRRNGIRLPDEPEHRVHPGQRGLSGRPRALTRSVARSCQIDVVVKRPPGRHHRNAPVRHEQGLHRFLLKARIQASYRRKNILYSTCHT